MEIQPWHATTTRPGERQPPGIPPAPLPQDLGRSASSSGPTPRGADRWSSSITIDGRLAVLPRQRVPGRFPTWGICGYEFGKGPGRRGPYHVLLCHDGKAVCDCRGPRPTWATANNAEPDAESCTECFYTNTGLEAARERSAWRRARVGHPPPVLFSPPPPPPAPQPRITKPPTTHLNTIEETFRCPRPLKV